jgi:flagellar biosynthesis GTPase FlhF
MTAETTAPTWERQIGAFLATWWQQIAITQAGIYLVASFGASHNILPWPAAWGLAIGMEGTYLKGLIDAGHVRGRGQGWATALIVATYVTVITWGIAYILGLPSVGVIPATDLGQAWGGALAAIHVLPIAITGLCSAMLHRARTAEAAQRRARQEAEAEARAQRLQAQVDQEAEQERAQRRAMSLEAERRQVAIDLEIREAEQKALARARVRAAQPAHPGLAHDARTEPHGAAQSPVRQISKEELYARVRAAHAHNPQFSRAELARETGWSEPMIRKVIKEIQGE